MCCGAQTCHYHNSNRALGAVEPPTVRYHNIQTAWCVVVHSAQICSVTDQPLPQFLHSVTYSVQKCTTTDLPLPQSLLSLTHIAWIVRTQTSHHHNFYRVWSVYLLLFDYHLCGLSADVFFHGCATSQQHAECISGTALLWEFYVLPHWDRSYRSNLYPVWSQYSDTGPTSPSANLNVPSIWQGTHLSTSL